MAESIKCLCGEVHDGEYYDEEVPFVCANRDCQATVMLTREMGDGKKYTLVEGGKYNYGGK